MSKHTPGPWVWQTDKQPYGQPFTGVYADGAAGDHLRCQVLGDNREADAALIARAPEMAEEIERLRATEERLETDRDNLCIELREAEAQRDQLKEAIEPFMRNIGYVARTSANGLYCDQVDALRAAIEECEK